MLSILVTAHIRAFNIIRSDLKQLRQSVLVVADGNLRQNLETIRGEIEYLRLAAFSSSHAELRTTFITTQMSQTKEKTWLVLGDSIVEGMYLASIEGQSVLNAGIGGGGC